VSDPTAPAFGSGNDSGCYAVKFNVDITPITGNTLSGVVTGDLEGTADITLLGASWPPTGATNTSTFDFRWHITGGVIPALVGSTFDTRSENRNILHFRLPPGRPFAQNVGSHRAVAGVSKANLTYTGETPIATFQTTLDHRGVICL
jgi:hypothetical protein